MIPLTATRALMRAALINPTRLSKLPIEIQQARYVKSIGSLWEGSILIGRASGRCCCARVVFRRRRNSARFCCIALTIDRQTRTQGIQGPIIRYVSR
jgi:hypothetical protein